MKDVGGLIARAVKDIDGTGLGAVRTEVVELVARFPAYAR
jgi:glycine/serine hydroxymethyltransferase